MATKLEKAKKWWFSDVSFKDKLPIIEKHFKDGVMVPLSGKNILTLFALENTTTVGGYQISNLRKLNTPVHRNLLDSFIYQAEVKYPPHIELPNELITQTILYDRFGRCSNWQRADIFLSPTYLKEITEYFN